MTMCVKRKWYVGIVLVLFAAVSCFAAVEEGSISTGPWKLSWNRDNGNWLVLAWNGCKIADNPSGSLAFEFQAPERNWIVSKSQFKTADWNEARKCLRITRTVGKWLFTEEIVFGVLGDENTISRTLHFTNTGSGPEKFYDVSIRTAIPPQGEYYLPVNAFDGRKKGRLEDLKSREKIHSGWNAWPILTAPAPELTVMYVADGRRDRISGSIRREARAIVVDNHFLAKGWAEPGVSQSVGPVYLRVVQGNLDAVFETAVWKWFDDIGLKVPSDRPQWIHDKVLYSMHPAGTIGSSFKDLGGFTAATEELLPRIADLGAGAIWLLPLEDRSCYWPRDYYKLTDNVGSMDDYRKFVKIAHGLGLKVWQDNVPHGGSPSYGQLRGNKPWWLVFDEKGDALHYWCFDFHEPAWQKYIAGVAEYYVKEVGIDGYRIDAVSGSHEMNWRRKGFPSIDHVPANVPGAWWKKEVEAVGGVPALSYERGSLALREGGLQMVRTIREQVRKHNPDGAVLAEVPNAPYMQEGDVVYDFALRSVMLRLRGSDPGEFVHGLQEWLYEQKYAEPRGTMRMRYVESHDTLRGAGFFGVSANRAFVALTCWIDGMPMIYHDADTWNMDHFGKILKVRNELEELRRGEAFYNWIDAEPENVFTCVRIHEGNASIAVINFSGEQCTAMIPIPWAKLKKTGPFRVWNAMTGTAAAGGDVSDIASVKLRLKPWEHTVLAIRPEKAPAPVTWPATAECRPVLSKVEGPISNLEHKAGLKVGEQTVVYECPAYRLEINRDNGMPLSFGDGADRELLKDVSWICSEGEAVSGRLGKGVFKQGKILEWNFGDAGIAYEFQKDHVRIRLTAGAGCTARRLGLLIRPAIADRCEIMTAEGRLSESITVRHSKGVPGSGSIYYRPQGSAAVWSSRLIPLLPDEAGVYCFDRSRSSGVAFELDRIESPNTGFMVLDRAAGKDGVHVAAMLRDSCWFVQDQPRNDSLDLILKPAGQGTAVSGKSHEVRLSHNSLGWVVENDHYRLNLSRAGGVIRQLSDRKNGDNIILKNNDLYTDHGFPVRIGNLRTGSDVETISSAWREGKVLHLRFEGMMRGDYRFSQSHPPLWFSVEYAFDSTASFATRWSIMSEGQVKEDRAFLAWKSVLPGMDGMKLFKDGKKIAEGKVEKGRSAETRKLTGSPVPDEIRVFSDGKTVVQMSSILTRAPEPLHNVFNHRDSLYMAWLDPPDKYIEPGAWYEVRSVVTVGDGAAGAGNQLAWVGSDVSGGVSDPSFEADGPESVLTVPAGKEVYFPAGVSVKGWEMPKDSRIVAPGHQGARCVMIENNDGSYALIRQQLNAREFPAGSTVEVSVWVKGEDIKVGDPGWKKGTIGLGCRMQNGKYQYPGAVDFSGSFDWKQVKGKIRIPEGAVTTGLRIGLNGATGKLWIDDVSVKRVEH